MRRSVPTTGGRREEYAEIRNDGSPATASVAFTEKEAFRQVVCSALVLIIIGLGVCATLLIMHFSRCNMQEAELDWWSGSPGSVDATNTSPTAEHLAWIITRLQTVLQASTTTETSRALQQDTVALVLASAESAQRGFAVVPSAQTPNTPLANSIADTACEVTLEVWGIGGEITINTTSATDRRLRVKRGTCAQFGSPLTHTWTPATIASDPTFRLYDTEQKVFSEFGLIKEEDLPTQLKIILLFIEDFNLPTTAAIAHDATRAARTSQSLVLVAESLRQHLTATGQVRIGIKATTATATPIPEAQTICLCPINPVTGSGCVQEKQTILAARSDSMHAPGDQLPDLAVLAQMANSLIHETSDASRLRTTLCVFESGSIWSVLKRGELQLQIQDVILLSHTGARNGIPVFMTSKSAFATELTPRPQATVVFRIASPTLQFQSPATRATWTITGAKVGTGSPLVTTAESAYTAAAIPALRTHSDEPVSVLVQPNTFSINCMISCLETLLWATNIAAAAPGSVGLSGIFSD